MTSRSLFGSLATALVLATPLASQQPIDGRLAGRVSPAVVAVVRELAPAAAARGLPIDPLIQKAIEGSAKGVPADLVAAAVRQVAAQLDTAAIALRSGGIAAPDTTVIAAGGFAVTAGLHETDIAELARAGAPAAELMVGLRVAGTLAALGVPPADAADLVAGSLSTGRPAADLLELPGRVQSEVAHGVTPAQAARGLARSAAAQQGRRGGGGGPPPGRGRPTHPPAHPHP